MDEIIRMAQGGSAPESEPEIPEEEEMPFYLEFNQPKNPDSDPGASVAIGKQYADGKYKLRLATLDDGYFRCTPDNGDSVRIRVYDGHPNSADIPSGAKSMTVRRESGESAVSATISSGS